MVAPIVLNASAYVSMLDASGAPLPLPRTSCHPEISRELMPQEKRLSEGFKYRRSTAVISGLDAE